MARRTCPDLPASGAQGPRVGRARSRSARRATRELLASVAAYDAAVARGAGGSDPAALALRYLAAGRPMELLREARPPLSLADQIKLNEAQAEVIADLIRKVLDELELSDAQFEHGIGIARDVLRKASAQDWWPA